MERKSRDSAVEDDLEFAERSPEPSPERPSSSMMPPFRRPAPPPATTASGPPRRSIGDLLPRRSLLAPEVATPLDEDYAKGRDSDERKSDVEPEKEKRDRRPRKKRRSRIMGELRPVEGPESALPSVPAIDGEDSQVSEDPLDSGERAKEAFAAQRVRMKKKWCPDLLIYMKNAHPLFGICAAHRHHPYKRGDRFLVLLVAILVALLLCGLFAIRDCCSKVDVPVAVVTRRLEMTQDLRSSAAYLGNLRGSRRTTVTSGLIKADAEELQCLAFYTDCSSSSAVCAVGSTCRPIDNDGADKNSSGAVQCVPDEMPSMECVVGNCPTGWNCNQSTNSCTPASNYMCYLPTTESTEERTSVQFAAESDGTFTAIEAIFQILQIAAKNHEEELRRHNSSSSAYTPEEQNAQQSQSPTASPSTSPAKTSSPSAVSSGSNSSSSSDNSSQSSSAASSASASHETSTATSNSSSTASSTSESASGSQPSESSSVKVSITEPVNSEVYSLSSTILVEWQVTLLSGPDLGFDQFRVDFSTDNGAFDTISANVSTSVSSSSSEDGNTTVFQYEWDLADNTSWLCTTCVLRICALDVESASDDSFCIRSDGKSGNNSSSRRLQSTVEGSGGGDVVTFRIVREAFECSCGLGYASFLLATVIIGASIPVVVLLSEPLVTFYRNRQVFRLFARRDGPVRPVIAGYTAKSATRKGRVVLILVLLALCVACGFVAAQINTTNFLTQKGDIVVLWVVTFAITVALGVLVYCTLVCFVLFSVRWWRECARERREPSGLSEFRSSLLSDDVNADNVSVTSPTSPGWTVRGSRE